MAQDNGRGDPWVRTQHLYAHHARVLDHIGHGVLVGTCDHGGEKEGEVKARPGGLGQHPHGLK